MGTHYDTLGLTPGASPVEIERQYRAIAKLVHPDVGGDAITFSVLQEAYDVLSDPASRAVYDQSLHLHRDQLATAQTPQSRAAESHQWFRSSTPTQRDQASRLARMGLTSWHQTPDEYAGAVLVRLRRAGITIVLTVTTLVVLRLLGVGW